MTTNTVTVERVAKAIRNAPLPVGGGVHMSHEQALTAARAAITALPPVTPAEAARVLGQTRAKDEHINAAMIAHYGTRSAELGINGVDLTSNGMNFSFKDGFKRMLKGYFRALTSDKEDG